MFHCSYSSCAQSSAHIDEWFLQFSGLGFFMLGPFHCTQIDLCLSVCISCFCCITVSTVGGPDEIEV